MGAKDRSPVTLTAMAHRHYAAYYDGDGAKSEFKLPATVGRLEDVWVFVAGLLLRPAAAGAANDYQVRGLSPGYGGDKNMVKLTAVPGAGVHVTVLAVGG